MSPFLAWILLYFEILEAEKANTLAYLFRASVTTSKVNNSDDATSFGQKTFTKKTFNQQQI